MKQINKTLLDKISSLAKKDTRLRKNFNFHESFEDSINRMLNAMEPGTYVRPHRHMEPQRTGVLILLRGKIKVVFFDDGGTVLRSVVLSHVEGQYGIEIGPDEWYSIVILESGSVVYEFKEGPYIPMSENDIADWAPDSDNKEAVLEFLDRMEVI